MRRRPYRRLTTTFDNINAPVAGKVSITFTNPPPRRPRPVDTCKFPDHKKPFQAPKRIFSNKRCVVCARLSCDARCVPRALHPAIPLKAASSTRIKMLPLPKIITALVAGSLIASVHGKRNNEDCCILLRIAIRVTQRYIYRERLYMYER